MRSETSADPSGRNVRPHGACRPVVSSTGSPSVATGPGDTVTSSRDALGVDARDGPVAGARASAWDGPGDAGAGAAEQAPAVKTASRAAVAARALIA
ncbi:hypothetical protein GCM10027203_50270 [Nonomuraea fastidiosa]